jgi:arylsulfatase A-like enzyme
VLLLAALSGCSQAPPPTVSLIQQLPEAEGSLSPAPISRHSTRELFDENWKASAGATLWVPSQGATLHYRSTGNFKRLLRFEARCVRDQLAFAPALELWLDGELLQAVALGPNWQGEELALPGGPTDGRVRRLEWRYSRGRAASGKPPMRVVAVRSLQFTYLTIREVALGEQARQCIALLGFGALRYRLRLAPGARLELGYGLDAPLGTPFGRFEVALQGETIWRGEVGPGQFKDLSLKLPRVRGDRAVLVLRARHAPGGSGRLLWAHPLVAGQDRTSTPNLILVSVDTLRADHLGCYGYPKPTSPSIDRMARKGVRFDQVATVFPGTLPAHASLLTSLYPNRHRVYAAPHAGLEVESAIPGSVPTLAGLLGAAGYRRAAWTGGGYLSPRRGFHHGFEFFHMPAAGEGSDDLKDTLVPATAWLRAGPPEPFFLFLHTYEVHEPFAPPPAYLRRFSSGERGRLPRDIHPNHFPRLRQMGLTEAERDYLIALYDAEIRYLDDAIGNLMEALRHAGLEQRTLLVLTSDHGQEFFDHGDIGHGTHLHPELIRIPLILRWPGRLPAGRVVRTPVTLVDVLPTLLAAARAPIPGKLDGRSLWPLLRGESQAPRAIAAETTWKGGYVAAREGQRKLIFELDSGQSQFYDLARDPMERRPLDPAAGPVDLELRRAVRNYVQQLRSRKAQGGPQAPLQLSPAERAKLRALGYLD